MPAYYEEYSDVSSKVHVFNMIDRGPIIECGHFTNLVNSRVPRVPPYMYQTFIINTFPTEQRQDKAG